MYDAGCHGACCRVPKTLQQAERRARMKRDGALKAPALGGVRRINSLRAGGWPVDKIAAELGVTPEAVDRMRRRADTGMYITTLRRIDAVFEALGSVPGPSESTRQRALSQGHHPPMSWYGIDIDDPKARPDDGRRERGIDLDEWAFLVRCGENVERATERCGVTLAAVERAAHRAGRKDLAALAASARNHARSTTT